MVNDEAADYLEFTRRKYCSKNDNKITVILNHMEK